MYAIINPTNPYTIEIRKTMVFGRDYYVWELVHRNGQVLCTSKYYTRKSRAINAAQKVSLNIINANFKTTD